MRKGHTHCSGWGASSLGCSSGWQTHSPSPSPSSGQGSLWLWNSDTLTRLLVPQGGAEAEGAAEAWGEEDPLESGTGSGGLLCLALTSSCSQPGYPSLSQGEGLPPHPAALEGHVPVTFRAQHPAHLPTHQRRTCLLDNTTRSEGEGVTVREARSPRQNQ